MEFLLNNELIVIDDSKAGISLLSFIRNEKHLTGTKSGCREGDCGACTVLEGRIKFGKLCYHSIVSCLTPLKNIEASHIVTVEGLNLNEGLSVVQSAINNNSATQCGFCTPGFVVSLTGYLLCENNKTDAKESVNGNICRCTGYKSIEKATEQIELFKNKTLETTSIASLIQNKVLPEYFLNIKKKLEKIKKEKENCNREFNVAGASDLMAQNIEIVKNTPFNALKNFVPNTVEIDGNRIRVGAAITFNEFFSNKIIREYFPQIGSYSTLVASEQIRNMATVGGNIVNASPIGDLSIIFLALNASLSIINFGDEERSVLLEKFYHGYKTIDLQKSELIYYIYLDIPHKETKFNFEKVSKRTKLDIASVNSAMSIRLEKNLIEEIHFSLGGVAPIPLYISSFASLLNGKELNMKLIKSALDEIGKSINPIDDIRGSGNYKKFLAYQLFMQHLMKLFPSSLEDTEILNLMNEKSRVL